jgi:hypothetical protein
MGGFDHPEANVVWIGKLIRTTYSQHLRHFCSDSWSEYRVN